MATAANPYSTLFGLGVGAFGNIFGDINQQKQQNWLNGGKINVLNSLNSLQDQARTGANSISGPLLSYLQGAMPAAGANFFNDVGGLNGWLQTGLGNSQSYGQMLDPQSIPGLSGLFDVNGGLLGAGNQGLQTAQALAGGQTGPQSTITNIGNWLGTNQASAPLQYDLMNAARGSVANGGYTPQLNAATQYGAGLLGPNAQVGQASNLASQIFGQGSPLLSPRQAVSMAIDQNATQAGHAASALRRQELNRSGTTGPAVASGQQGDVLGLIGDQALQSQSQAVRDALNSQQSLGLQQLGLGTNLFNGAQGAQLGNQGQGLNAILQSAAQAGSLQGTLGQLGLGGGNLGLNTMTSGGSLLNNVLGSQLGGLGATGSLMNSSNGITNDEIQSLLASQGLGQTQKLNSNNSLASMLGLLNQSAGQNLQGSLGYGQQSGSALQDYLNQLTQATTSSVGLFGQNSPAQNIWGNIGA